MKGFVFFDFKGEVPCLENKDPFKFKGICDFKGSLN